MQKVNRLWFTLPIAVMLLIFKEEKVLLGRRFQTGFMDGCYALPGGSHDGNEPLTKAAAREAYEELGIVCPTEGLVSSSFIHFKKDPARKGTHREMLYASFEITAYEGEIFNAEPHKCDDLQFFPLAALPENLTDMSRYCITQHLQGTRYSEIGWS